jgi:hypothetical protein
MRSRRHVGRGSPPAREPGRPMSALDGQGKPRVPEGRCRPPLLRSHRRNGGHRPGTAPGEREQTADREHLRRGETRRRWAHPRIDRISRIPAPMDETIAPQSDLAHLPERVRVTQGLAPEHRLDLGRQCGVPGLEQRHGGELCAGLAAAERLEVAGPAADEGGPPYLLQWARATARDSGSPAVPAWLIAPCGRYGLGGVATGAVGA